MESVLVEVREVVTGLKLRTEPKVYLFGSRLNHDSFWSDIDVLIVCESERDGTRVRAALQEVCYHYPLHLTIMTINEEIEFGFIESEGCRQIN